MHIACMATWSEEHGLDAPHVSSKVALLRAGHRADAESLWRVRSTWRIRSWRWPEPIRSGRRCVRLGAGMPIALTASALCDDLVQLYREDELDSAALLGALTAATMRAVSAALRIALP